MTQPMWQYLFNRAIKENRMDDAYRVALIIIELGPEGN